MYVVDETNCEQRAGVGEIKQNATQLLFSPTKNNLTHIISGTTNEAVRASIFHPHPVHVIAALRLKRRDARERLTDVGALRLSPSAAE